jgi:hypothetical protein
MSNRKFEAAAHIIGVDVDRRPIKITVEGWIASEVRQQGEHLVTAKERVADFLDAV